jgi:hypothetical protein
MTQTKRKNACVCGHLTAEICYFINIGNFAISQKKDLPRTTFWWIFGLQPLQWFEQFRSTKIGVHGLDHRFGLLHIVLIILSCHYIIKKGDVLTGQYNK